MNDRQATVATPHFSYLREPTGATEPPVVLIHGVGESGSSWTKVSQAMGDDRTIISYDLRGHGRSPNPPGPWTIDDFAEDHARLLSLLKVEQADVVGFSLGGLIAQRVAAQRPESVRRLVLIGSVAGRTAEERDAVRARLRMVEQEGPAGAALRSVERWYSKAFLAQHPEARDKTIQRMSRLDRDGYTNAYRVLAGTDLLEDLPKIGAPTLAMTGEHDVGSPPRMARTIAEKVQHGSALVIEGARHSVLSEAPERIAKEIIQHVR